jgi:hypothetical protein
MRIVIIHYLENNPLTECESDSIKANLECDYCIAIRACNQLEHMQYPMITVEEID